MSTTGLPHWPWHCAEADALPAAERLVVDAARARAAAARQARQRTAALRHVLVTEGAEAVTGPLEALLTTLARRSLTLG